LQNSQPVKWLTVNQVATERAFALEIQARAQGIPFVDMQAKLDQGDTPKDPRLALAQLVTDPATLDVTDAPDPDAQIPMVPLVSDADMDHMMLGDDIPLEVLTRRGLVSQDMSRHELDARLRRLKQSTYSRQKREQEAMEAGWFAASDARDGDRIRVPLTPTPGGGDLPSQGHGRTASVVPETPEARARVVLGDVQAMLGELKRRLHPERSTA
jgi:hypothetical protein